MLYLNINIFIFILFLSVFTRKFIIFLFLTLIYCQIFVLDFFLFSCLFYHFFHILIHTEYKIRQKETFTNDDQKLYFCLSFLFFIYSFIGWILEVVQSAFHQKRLVNRGFINSPLCISYGIGAIVITINTHQMTGLWIFAAAMIDATVIEWFGGHFIEHFYHERWWDYSKNKWNLDGYICLSHSVFWGLLGYIGVKFVNPLLFKFYHLIPPFIRHLIIFILLAVLIIDILATTIVVFGKISINDVGNLRMLILQRSA